MKILTLSILKAAHACEPQVELFKRLYPEGLEATVANAKAAQAAGLDIFWAANLLSPSARAAYQDATASASAAYRAATSPAWEAYQAAKISALVAALQGMED
jgi:hypothetical protein